MPLILRHALFTLLLFATFTGHSQIATIYSNDFQIDIESNDNFRLFKEGLLDFTVTDNQFSGTKFLEVYPLYNFLPLHQHLSDEFNAVFKNGQLTKGILAFQHDKVGYNLYVGGDVGRDSGTIKVYRPAEYPRGYPAEMDSRVITDVKQQCDFEFFQYTYNSLEERRYMYMVPQHIFALEQVASISFHDGKITEFKSHNAGVVYNTHIFKDIDDSEIVYTKYINNSNQHYFARYKLISGRKQYLDTVNIKAYFEQTEFSPFDFQSEGYVHNGFSIYLDEEFTLHLSPSYAQPYDFHGERTLKTPWNYVFSKDNMQVSLRRNLLTYSVEILPYFNKNSDYETKYFKPIRLDIFGQKTTKEFSHIPAINLSSKEEQELTNLKYLSGLYPKKSLINKLDSAYNKIFSSIQFSELEYLTIEGMKRGLKTPAKPEINFSDIYPDFKKLLEYENSLDLKLREYQNNPSVRNSGAWEAIRDALNEQKAIFNNYAENYGKKLVVRNNNEVELSCGISLDHSGIGRIVFSDIRVKVKNINSGNLVFSNAEILLKTSFGSFIDEFNIDGLQLSFLDSPSDVFRVKYNTGNKSNGYFEIDGIDLYSGNFRNYLRSNGYGSSALAVDVFVPSTIVSNLTNLSQESFANLVSDYFGVFSTLNSKKLKQKLKRNFQ
jgi:hypothetical protein